MKLMKIFALAIVMAVSAIGPARADTAETIREHLYTGTSAAGYEVMSTLAADDPEAAFGMALFRFLVGIEQLAQAFNAHGFSPEQGIFVSPLLGAAGRIAAPDEAVEPLSYQAMRSYLADFAVAMDEAKALLLTASESNEFAVEIDLLQIRIDLDGDGVGGEHEAIGAILGQLGGMGARLDISDAELIDVPEARFAFDAADTIWLAGYSQVLALQADFLLAHDFEDFFGSFMHRFFPGAGLPMEQHLSGRTFFMDRDSDLLIADAIAAIHTINWPVIEPERLANVQTRLLEIVELSRANWAAILDETDDHLEFMPGPHQTPVFPEMEVSKEMVQAWLLTLDSAEKIFAGELLIPHWRFTGLGFDLTQYLQSAERTDIVLILTGYGALPFLREGKIASAEDFEAGLEIFGDSIWGYALWFN